MSSVSPGSDLDVVLERADSARWPNFDQLHSHQIVQLFSELHDLPPNAGPPAAAEPRQSTDIRSRICCRPGP